MLLVPTNSSNSRAIDFLDAQIYNLKRSVLLNEELINDTLVAKYRKPLAFRRS